MHRRGGRPRRPSGPGHLSAPVEVFRRRKSLKEMVMSTSATAVGARPRPGLFRRVVIPLFGIALIFVGLGLPRAWRWADYDPQPQFTIDWICSLAIPVGALILLLWLAFLSGFRWQIRLAVLGAFAALGAGLAASVDHIEVTGDVGLIPVFKWEVRPRVAAFPPEGGTDGLQPIDLKVDPVRDFPRYRGAHADGLVRGVTLAKDWQAHPPREVWRRPCGGGFAGFAVAGNVAVTVEQRGADE